MRAEPSTSAPAEDGAPLADAIRARERGISLLRRANRWLIGLALLLAGALTGLTAHAFHANPASAQTTTAPSATSGAGASAPQLQSPASPPAAAAPAPAPAPAGPVVSGGS